MNGERTGASWRGLVQLDQAQRRRREIEAISELSAGDLPTSESLRKYLVWNPRRENLLRHHVFWEEWKIREGLFALISSALTAHLDLLRVEAALTAYASSRGAFEDHVAATIENPGQKEVLAFASSVSGTQDTLRRLEKRRSDLGEQISALKSTHFDCDEIKFILDLRKNLSHGSVVVPTWSVSSDFDTTRGSLVFDCEELLFFGEWSARSKQFLGGVEDGRLAIARVTEKCATIYSTFRSRLKMVLRENIRMDESDFFAIRDESRRVASTQFAKMLLRGMSGVSPERIIAHVFSESEARRLSEIKDDPRAVEAFIIGLKSHEYVFDEDLLNLVRPLIYAYCSGAAPASRN